MTTILVDHDIEGQATVLWGVLAAEGWPDLFPLRLVRFSDIGLDKASTDREVWRFAQSRDMILLTNNRNMDGIDSLEQTLRDENIQTSTPVLTIGRVDRLSEAAYRERCAARLLEIALDLNKHLGRGRIYIP